MASSPRIALASQTAEPHQDRQFVAALERGLRLLRSFSSAHETLSNAELSRRTSLAKPTISRITHTLSLLGYLAREQHSGLYRLGPEALGLGYASLSKLDARHVARPHMQRLAEYARASVALCARDQLSMIYLELRRSPQALGLGLDIGDRVPLATTSVGRAYLAAIDEAERRPLLDQIRRADVKEWPRVRKGIEQAICDLEQRGFTTSFGDWLPEIHSTGVPLKIKSPYGTLAFNIGGLASSLPASTIVHDLGPRLVSMARLVAATLAPDTGEAHQGPAGATRTTEQPSRSSNSPRSVARARK